MDKTGRGAGGGVGDQWIKLGDWKLGVIAKTSLHIWPLVFLPRFLNIVTGSMQPAAQTA